MPTSAPLSASLRAADVTVVSPELFQSNPSTQPSAWNQRGSDTLSSNPLLPFSSTRISEIPLASRTILQ
jgi:hypothetical protein